MNKSKIKLITVSIISAIVIIAVCFGFISHIKSLRNEYNRGKELLEKGYYEEAYQIFQELSEVPEYNGMIELEANKQLTADYIELRKAEALISEKNYYEAMKHLLPIDYIPEAYDYIQECILHMLINPSVGESYS